MFAQLFWPKAMREAVKNFKAEGILNKEAVRYVNKKIYIMFAIYISIAAILYFTGGKTEQTIGCSILLLSPFFVKFDVWQFYRRQMAPYVNGTTQLAISMGGGTSLYGTQRINFILSNNKEVKGRVFIGTKPRLNSTDEYLAGTQFIVFKEDSKSFAMPDIGILKESYSLKLNHGE